MSFADRLDTAVAHADSPCVLGLDAHLDLLPEEFAVARDPKAARCERAAAVADFLCRLIDIAAERVALVKPQSAFFELFGADGAVAWERVVAHAHDAGLLVIGDVKRGDIASTATAYAKAFLEGPGGGPDHRLCDAVTVNAFLGNDSIEPFLEVCRRTGSGIFVLVRTSNPGSSDFQTHGEPTLSHRLARATHRWGWDLRGECGLSSVGAVVGATHPALLAQMRELMPHTPFLLPGFGTQGGGPADVLGAFTARAGAALVSSSRGVAYAYRQSEYAGLHWADAASAALDAMVGGVRDALASR
ncbi:MAG: orotidine-5'-phosphate decarboxylase [Planctomycetota bacterium]|jgi:orotidine-5'-phosphate decarboxylase|nr:orotidine-5'-phosphate decarboxylase [Planctomycetota bacterium]